MYTAFPCPDYYRSSVAFRQPQLAMSLPVDQLADEFDRIRLWSTVRVVESGIDAIESRRPPNESSRDRVRAILIS